MVFLRIPVYLSLYGYLFVLGNYLYLHTIHNSCDVLTAELCATLDRIEYLQ